VDPPDARNEGSAEPTKYESGGLPIEFSLDPLSTFDVGRVIVEPVLPVDERFGRFGGRCLALCHVLTTQECEYLIAEMTAQSTMEQVSYRHEYR